VDVWGSMIQAEESEITCMLFFGAGNLYANKVVIVANKVYALFNDTLTKNPPFMFRINNL